MINEFEFDCYMRVYNSKFSGPPITSPIFSCKKHPPPHFNRHRPHTIWIIAQRKSILRVKRILQIKDRQI